MSVTGRGREREYGRRCGAIRPQTVLIVGLAGVIVFSSGVTLYGLFGRGKRPPKTPPAARYQCEACRREWEKPAGRERAMVVGMAQAVPCPPCPQCGSPQTVVMTRCRKCLQWSVTEGNRFAAKVLSGRAAPPAEPVQLPPPLCPFCKTLLFGEPAGARSGAGGTGP